MKDLKIVSLILILSIITNCTSSIKIKNKPDSERNWLLCTRCEGKGIVIVSISKDSADDVTGNPGNEYLFCLIPLAVLGIIADREYHKDHPAREKSTDYENPDIEGGYSSMTNSETQRTVVKKKDKCPQCDGTGWIEYVSGNGSSPIIKKRLQIQEKDGKIEFEEKNPAD